MASFIDIHPLVIADDESKYPRSPLFGVQSDWSRERPVTIDGLIAAMDQAGVAKAAIVQSSTCYGYDNSYLVDSIAKYPGRITAVGSVDMLQPDAPEQIRSWRDKGVTGLRLFTGGSTAAFDTSSVDDPRSFSSWELSGEAGMSMSLLIDPSGLLQVAGMAKRFPKVRIILDNLARPDVTDGPPYAKAAGLFELAKYENIYLKLTPRIFVDARRGQATPETFFPRLVEVFGAHRMAWGSNFPALEGALAAHLEKAKMGLQVLSKEDQEWIFSKTAQTLYPALAD
jgi:L-fuconolactonase